MHVRLLVSQHSASTSCKACRMDIKLRDDAVLVADTDGGAEFLSLQPGGLVDHVASMTDESALKRIIQGDEIGGSRRVDMQEVQRILGDCCMLLPPALPQHDALATFQR